MNPQEIPDPDQPPSKQPDPAVPPWTLESLEIRLWEIAVAEVAPRNYHDQCQLDTRRFIKEGVGNMFATGRISSADVAIAEEHMRELVGLMVQAAAAAGHPNEIGENTLADAIRNIQLRVEFFPFWPPPWSRRP